jgi:hypothetical protein
MLAPGLPDTVSRTWQVMKGRAWAMVIDGSGGWLGVVGCGENCDVISFSRP